MQGAQKLRPEAHLSLRRNDEVAAQRRRWTFYETINSQLKKKENENKNWDGCHCLRRSLW